MIRRLTHSGRALIIHTRPSLGLKQRHGGFTLLELLVVLVIIGVMVAMAALSFGVLGRDRQTEEESRRFWTVLKQAREEAELQVEDIGIFMSTGAYEYMRFDSRKNEWQPIEGDELFMQRELPAGLRFRLRLEAREVVLKPSLPNRGDKDENKRNPPHVMVLSSGDVSPFELEIERENQPAQWRVTALADNDLRVEVRDERDQWGPLLQTRPPKDDKKQPTRVSSAR
ncbi:type II secretion system minor pseudopilin GspH [Peristeroidobacter soli]|jgi:general secretion pathway protein H|uniref:type II secretion system minor pseudopilin GspH n=1 Tax=Peristeroidobacter soli TaxID=2497877 RepID=UPI00101DCC9A|nr:type II secretion system minor pseudopilin GspH [Peristeroidobacter soli]